MLHVSMRTGPGASPLRRAGEAAPAARVGGPARRKGHRKMTPDRGAWLAIRRGRGDAPCPAADEQVVTARPTGRR